MEHLMLLENPRGRKKGRKNKPKRRSFSSRIPGMSSLNKGFMGVKPIEVAAAVGGLAAATMIPGMFIKTTTTTTNKLLKVGLSFVVAVVVGGFAKGIVGYEAARAATFGGLAGAGAQTLGAFTSFKIGGGNVMRSLPMGRGIAAADLVSPTRSREGENVSVINP